MKRGIFVSVCAENPDKSSSWRKWDEKQQVRQGRRRRRWWSCHNGCSGLQNVKLQECLDAGRGEERTPAGQHLLPLSWSVVTFRRRRTRSSSVSPLSVSRDFRLRELVDLFSVSYSKRKAWEALWGQMMPSSSCTQLQNLSHCSCRAACQALPLVPEQQLGSTPQPTLIWAHAAGTNHTHYTSGGGYQAEERCPGPATDEQILMFVGNCQLPPFWHVKNLKKLLESYHAHN